MREVSETESSTVTGNAAQSPAKKSFGCGAAIIFGIILFILLGIGGNMALGEYFENCEPDEDIMDCMFAMAEQEEEGATTATGTYTFKDYSVEVTMNIPLSGGNVTGSVTGACDGAVKGTYNGQDNGPISGTIRGSCDPFFVKIPATATFNGTVNKTGKSVPIRFTGSGAGFTHTDSMSLSF